MIKSNSYGSNNIDSSSNIHVHSRWKELPLHIVQCKIAKFIPN